MNEKVKWVELEHLDHENQIEKVAV